MKLLRQLFIILAICLAGEFFHRFLHLPIPGNVLGMILLLICLCKGIIKVEMIEDITKFLLDHLAFFFLPAGVGLIIYFDLLKANWIPIFTICFAITIIVMIVTGRTVQFLKRGHKK